jgi:hypothetical protein
LWRLLTVSGDNHRRWEAPRVVARGLRWKAIVWVLNEKTAVRRRWWVRS